MKIAKHVRKLFLNKAFSIYHDDYGVLRFTKKEPESFGLFCVERDGKLLFETISDSYEEAYANTPKHNSSAKVVEVQIVKKDVVNTASILSVIPAMIEASFNNLTDEEIQAMFRETGYEYADALANYYIDQRKGNNPT